MNLSLMKLKLFEFKQKKISQQGNVLKTVLTYIMPTYFNVNHALKALMTDMSITLTRKDINTLKRKYGVFHNNF